MRISQPDTERLEARATDFVVRLAFHGFFWRSLQPVRPFVPIAIPRMQAPLLPVRPLVLRGGH